MEQEMWVEGLDPDGNKVIMKIDGELLEKMREAMKPPPMSIMVNDNESVSLVDMGLYENDILPLKINGFVELEIDDE